MRCLLLVFTVVLMWASSAVAAPQLVLDQLEIDWGAIYSGEKREHRFILTNAGDEPLEIVKVHSSCGCTTAMATQQLIEPGEQAELTVQFNSKNFHGQVVKRVVITSNDPQQPKIQLHLKAKVQSELTLSASRLQLGRLEGGKKVVKTLMLINQSDRAVQIIALRCTSAALRVAAVPQQLLAGERYPLELTILPPDKTGARVNGYLLIESQGHARTQLRLPVMGQVK